MNLEVKKLQNPKYRVVYHAHTTNIIALTFVLPLEDRVFTRELWEMATECPVVFPAGVGVVPWMVPGGRGDRGCHERADEENMILLSGHTTACSPQGGL